MIFDEGQEQEGILLEQKSLQVGATWVGVSARSEPSQKAEERGRHLISEGPVGRELQGTEWFWKLLVQSHGLLWRRG